MSIFSGFNGSPQFIIIVSVLIVLMYEFKLIVVVLFAAIYTGIL